ncbi:MAG: hypothetical protein H0W25_06055, partial [Acidimicrobiia bacterium]|nr:hypothetical protein [Acidimicrobiia bacterium]
MTTDETPHVLDADEPTVAEQPGPGRTRRALFTAAFAGLAGVAAACSEDDGGDADGGGDGGGAA